MTNIKELKEHIKKIDLIPNQSWISGLDERKKKELDFHNRDRDRINQSKIDQDTYDKFYGNKKFYLTVKKSTDFVEKWMDRYCPGKVFLDYACGNGGNAISAAKRNAKLAIGFDISDVSVQNARHDAQELGLSNIIFFQADAENTKLPDSCVDTIICSGMLHHLDLSYAFPELRRILSPGGRILAIEALDYNPLIKIYRMMTPDMRTEWEKAHILDLSDLNFAKRFFEIGEVNYWHICSYAGAYLPSCLPLFNAVDGFLTRIPGLRLMSWIFTFELIKK